MCIFKKILVCCVLLIAIRGGVEVFQYAQKLQFDEDVTYYADYEAQRIVDHWQCLSSYEDKQNFALSLIERLAPHDFKILQEGRSIKRELEKKEALGALTVDEREVLLSPYYWTACSGRACYDKFLKHDKNFSPRVTDQETVKVEYKKGDVSGDFVLSVIYQDEYSRWNMPTVETEFDWKRRFSGNDPIFQDEDFRKKFIKSIEFLSPLEREFTAMGFFERKKALDNLRLYSSLISGIKFDSEAMLKSMPADDVPLGSEEIVKNEIFVKKKCDFLQDQIKQYVGSNDRDLMESAYKKDTKQFIQVLLDGIHEYSVVNFVNKFDTKEWRVLKSGSSTVISSNNSSFGGMINGSVIDLFLFSFEEATKANFPEMLKESGINVYEMCSVGGVNKSRVFNLLAGNEGQAAVLHMMDEFIGVGPNAGQTVTYASIHVVENGQKIRNSEDCQEFLRKSLATSAYEFDQDTYLYGAEL